MPSQSEVTSLHSLPRFAPFDPPNGFYISSPCEENTSIRKGLLWQQRDKLFSRWKERYFVLTRDYLICFHKANRGIARSEMGSFIFKISLTEVAAVEKEERKSGSAILLTLQRDGKLLLRCKTDLEDWLAVLKETVKSSKGRREALRHTLSRDVPSQTLDGLQHFRGKIPLQPTLSDSRQEVARINRIVAEEMRGTSLPRPQRFFGAPDDRRNSLRLSLMTDADFDSSTLGGDVDSLPSTPSCRLSSVPTPDGTPQGSVNLSRSASRTSSEKHDYYYDAGERFRFAGNVGRHPDVASKITRSSTERQSPQGDPRVPDVVHTSRIGSSRRRRPEDDGNMESDARVADVTSVRRFSLASPTEVTQNGMGFYFEQDDYPRSNGNLSRIASERHANRTCIAEQAYRGNSNDVRRKCRPVNIHARTQDDDLRAQQSTGIYTHL